jgi:UDP-glucuronate 4-epimerase
MNVLVTGAAGFIGSHLAERLRARGDAVIGFDNFDPFYDRAVKERNVREASLSLIEGDLRRPDDLTRAFTQHPIDAVVHLAALAGVRPSLLEPQRFWDVNVMGTLNLLEAARHHGVRRIVFASSSSVYGGDGAVPFRESDPCGHPLSPYAASKRAGELMAWNAHHLHGLSITALRLFTVYGPRQRPDLAIHKFTRLIAAGQPIELFGDGSTSRDYTWVGDIVDGIISALDHSATPGFRIYNLGGSGATSLRELVDRIAGALGRAPIIQWKPEQPGDMKETLADISLAGRELGYAPRVKIADGIPRFVEWFSSAQSRST